MFEIGAYLELDVFARTSSSCALRTASLDDKVRLDAVKLQTVIKARFGQTDEVRGRNRSILLVELEPDRTLVRLDDRRCDLMLQS